MPLTKKTAPAPKKPEGPSKKAPQPFSLVRGVRDILPADQPYWRQAFEMAQSLCDAYSVDRIETPVLEETGLFVRSVGKQTDIVEKEMFSFETTGNEHVTLRPENTASICRSYIHHGMLNLPQPVKLWYWGPQFRHERPQSGRYRQFWQYGVEMIGESDAVIDAQLALIAWRFLKDLGIDTVVRINSIGTPESRINYRNALVAYFRPKRNRLSEEDKKRLLKNPLRLLDSKDPAMAELKAEAPQIVDWLDEPSKNHFMRVLEYLDEVGVPYQLDPFLVRGLDYYTQTVFELYDTSETDETAQSALGGGGRYDGLMEILGGRPTPAAGFALGIDRIISKLKALKPTLPEKKVEVFVAQLGEAGRKRALALFEELRLANIKTAEAFAKGSIKVQMEIANRLGARWAIIVGQKEVLDGTAIIRDMDAGTQEIVDGRKVVHELQKKMTQVPVASNE
ncbi:MAG: histidine--tRNA ligase [Patescibacteria group bacterium]|nr:histidine--tRNA ligase [Patescibacteria group bacterium]